MSHKRWYELFRPSLIFATLLDMIFMTCIASRNWKLPLNNIITTTIFSKSVVSSWRASTYPVNTPWFIMSNWSVPLEHPMGSVFPSQNQNISRQWKSPGDNPVVGRLLSKCSLPTHISISWLLLMLISPAMACWMEHVYHGSLPNSVQIFLWIILLFIHHYLGIIAPAANNSIFQWQPGLAASKLEDDNNKNNNNNNKNNDNERDISGPAVESRVDLGKTFFF